MVTLALVEADGLSRVCGGTGLGIGQQANLQGLSPRVRGNRVAKAGRVAAFGSIPACAGEPSGAGRRGRGQGVYPRVCGGTSPARVTASVLPGLSPRVRGNRGAAILPRNGQRSIPACAGEPTAAARSSALLAVYPRVCGGTARISSRESTRRGLSPRVRGNLDPGVVGGVGGRSIPACAGEPRRGCGPMA